MLWEPRRRRLTIGLGLASVGLLAGAIVAAVHGYDPNAASCPDGAPQPVAFWPLLVASLAVAIAAFVTRPRLRDARGERSGADVLAIVLAVVVPIGFAVTAIAEGIAYACWE